MVETRAPAEPVRPEKPRYRNDIDGLRAIAVLLVVVYHVWLGRVSGGVDAFLMISAFLLTGSLMRKLEGGDRMPVAAQWVRNFKRMLPAAAIVILGIAAAGLALLPASSLASLWRHSLSSIFYVENWLLASESIDYYADTSLASPLQHFWSLSIQGQVFLLWPLFFALIAILSRKVLTRVSPRTIALATFGAILVASLTYSIVSTASRQEFAYFDTGARLWEFAAGSILALLLPHIRLGTLVRAVLGWAGLLALLVCGIVLDVQGGFPGYLALWPVLSVAAIIVAGSGGDRRGGPAALLETTPVLSLGRASYALYLVHWPLLVFTLVVRHGEPLSLLEGLVLIAVSIALAYLLTALVDRPLRNLAWLNGPSWHGAIAIALSVLITAAPLIGLQLSTKQAVAEEAEAIAAESEAQKDRANPGAAVLFGGAEEVSDEDFPRRPLPSEVPTQWGSLSQDCSDGSLMKLPKSVELCFENGLTDGDRTVVVIGNSHAQQMLEPLGAIAEEQNWHAISFLYAACAVGIRDVDESKGIFYSQECRDWNEDVIDLLERINPDVVVTIGTESVPADSTSPSDAGEREHTLEGVEKSIDRITNLGIPVLLIRDNPRFTFDSYQCTEQFGADEPKCATEVGQALAASDPSEELLQPGVSTIDLTELFCPDGACIPVIGNVNVYIDRDHLSLVYARTLYPVLEEEILRSLAQFEEEGFAPA